MKTKFIILLLVLAGIYIIGSVCIAFIETAATSKLKQLQSITFVVDSDTVTVKSYALDPSEVILSNDKIINIDTLLNLNRVK